MFAELLGSDNVRLSLSAGKALANMEESMKKHGIYNNFVYLLHPLQQTDDPSDTLTNKSSHQRTVKLFIQSFRSSQVSYSQVN